MTTAQKKPAETKKSTKSSSGNAELKTDFPISEKDEVKKAEQRTNKGSGKSK